MTIAGALLSFAVVAALLTVIPGLDTALVLRAAISKGRGYAFATAVGINTGALMWGVAAAVGASALLAATEFGFRVLTLAGAAYMVGLGVHLLWTSRRDRMPAAQNTSTQHTSAQRTATKNTAAKNTAAQNTAAQRTADAAVGATGGAPASLWQGWLIGVGTNLLNPKVGVFYLATIPLFIPPGSPPLLMGVLLALVHTVLGFVWFSLIIVGTGFAARWLKNARTTRIIDQITGAALIGFGAVLAFQRQ